MAPLFSPMLSSPSPPQMNTDLPMATTAAFERAAICGGGMAIGNQPPAQTLSTHVRFAVQVTVQGPLALPAASDSPALPPVTLLAPPVEASPPFAPPVPNESSCNR